MALRADTQRASRSLLKNCDNERSEHTSESGASRLRHYHEISEVRWNLEGSENGAKVQDVDEQIGRWAWDVVLGIGP
jgi:hypothetical protein